jgi:multiple sugar transport system permease protein
MRHDTALGLDALRGRPAKFGRFLVYTMLVLVFAGPLLALLVSAFAPAQDPTSLTLIPRSLTLENFRAAIRRDVLHYLFNSFVVVGFGLLLQIAVSVSAAYALARKRFPGLRLVFLLILSTMMLPEEILAIPLSLVLADVPLVHINLIGTLAGMIVPVGAWAFSILVMTEFMRDIPVELEEAARLDGAGDLRIFWSVTSTCCRCSSRRTPGTSRCRWPCARCAATSRSASACCWRPRCWPCCRRSSRSSPCSGSSCAGSPPAPSKADPITTIDRST